MLILSPAAFLSTNQAAPFGYMCEYIARGAARKILSDTGDVEQFNFYEPLFMEQERTGFGKKEVKGNLLLHELKLYSVPHKAKTQLILYLE